MKPLPGAQGPKFETIEDFWRMVHEQRVAVIVMLARGFETDEAGKRIERSAQYFPTRLGQMEVFGGCTVSLLSQVRHPCACVHACVCCACAAERPSCMCWTACATMQGAQLQVHLILFFQH